MMYKKTCLVRTQKKSFLITPLHPQTMMFQEAIGHCRWKTVLRDNVLNKIDISSYENKTFEEIFVDIYSICVNVKGVGLLAVYDITAALCRHYEINIEKVYIIGNGPKRAVKLLNIKTKVHKINEQIKIKYADISDFNTNITNGDTLESYLCNWQKKYIL